MNNIKEYKLLNLDLASSTLLIISILIGIILTYNKKEEYKNKGFINKRDVQKINISNRILAIAIVIISIVSNTEGYNVAKQKNKKLKNYKLQIFSSYTLLIPALIGLYIALTSEDSIASIENSII